MKYLRKKLKNIDMNSLPLSGDKSVCCDIPKGVKPYRTPKFSTLATLLISGVTVDIGTPYTRADVDACMSSSLLNAAIKLPSWDK